MARDGVGVYSYVFACAGVLCRLLRLLPHPRFEDLLAQANGLRCDLDELVLTNIFEGLLERQLAQGREVEGVVGAGGADVGELLVLANVDVEVVLTAVLANDHADVDFGRRSDKEAAALLELPDGVREGAP